MSSLMRNAHGMTLTEVLVASAMAVIVAVGLIATDISRARMEQDIRNRSSMTSPERGNAARAVLQISKRAETADLIDLDLATYGVYQFRTPTGCTAATLPACLDVAANYNWTQYRLNGTQLEFNTRDGATGCGAWRVLARQISSFTMQYKDESPPPAGGSEPPNQDNNMVEFTIGWNNAAAGLSQDFTSQVAIRAGAYTDVDSGLAPTSALSPPSAACP